MTDPEYGFAPCPIVGCHIEGEHAHTSGTSGTQANLGLTGTKRLGVTDAYKYRDEAHLLTRERDEAVAERDALREQVQALNKRIEALVMVAGEPDPENPGPEETIHV